MSLIGRFPVVLVLGLLIGVASPIAVSGFSQGLATTSPQLVHVTILNGAGTTNTSPGFSPNQITVVIGVNNTVVWTDQDTTKDNFDYLPNHTVVANDNSFTSQSLSGGESFNYTFTSQGTYKYHCGIHPWMSGTVVVKSSVVPEFPAPVAVLLAALVLAVVALSVGTRGRLPWFPTAR